jgi:hypothetical protein
MGKSVCWNPQKELKPFQNAPLSTINPTRTDLARNPEPRRQAKAVKHNATFRSLKHFVNKCQLERNQAAESLNNHVVPPFRHWIHVRVFTAEYVMLELQTCCGIRYSRWQRKCAVYVQFKDQLDVLCYLFLFFFILSSTCFGCYLYPSHALHDLPTPVWNWPC